MKIERIITTIDSHTAGEPTRVITSGLPHIPGDTMVKKMEYFRENLDFIRTTIIHEPRGHKNMHGAVLLPPTKKEASFGVFYFDTKNYNSMCGHGTIGVCVTLIKMGWIPASEPETEIILDTPDGLVSTKLRIENGEVISASLINLPSFLYAENIKISLPQGKISVDVSYGGDFYTLVNGEDIGLNMVPDNITNLVQYAYLISDEINKAIEVVHPLQKHIKSKGCVYFYGPPSNSQADAKGVEVSLGGNVDRSPCGTGTSARMAALYARGKLKPGDKFCMESISGTLFHGEIIKETKVGDFLAIIPKITASAYITGFHQFVIEPSDPLKKGFIL